MEFVAAEGGKYSCESKGDTVTFYYGAAGVGLSAGFKLPKIGKLELKVKGKSVGLVVAPADFPNGGRLYVLGLFDGDELSATDIQGVCMFLEAGGGLIAGVSATAMLVGMNPIYLAGLAMAAPLGPAAAMYLDAKLLASATGLLVMGGVNAGVQAGGGIGAFLGGLY